MFGNAVEGKTQLVVAGLADLLTTGRVLIIEDVVCTKLLEEIEVVRGRGCVDFRAGELGKLHSESAGRCGGAVDENRRVRGDLCGRQRQAEDLVEALADGGDANTQRSALFPRHGVAQFGVDADLCFDVLGEGAIGVVCWVAWISSAIGLIMGR